MRIFLKRLLILPVLGMLTLSLSACSSNGAVPRGYEAKTYGVTEEFHSVSITAKTADITLLPSEDGTCRVECAEKKRLTYAVTVKDGVLNVELHDVRAWYELIFNFATPSLTIYLPKTAYDALAIQGSTGKVSLSAGFTFGSIDVALSTGDTECYASATGAVKIKGSTGRVRLEDSAVGSLDIETSTGDVFLARVAVTGEASVAVSTGDVAATDVTAAAFRSKGSTGHATLTNLTAATVEIERNTGRTTMTGCEVTDLILENSTGDVALTDVRTARLVSEADTGDLTLTNTLVAEKLTVKRDTGDVTFCDSDAGEILIETDTGKVTGTLLTEKIFIVRSDAGRIDVPESVNGGKCKITTNTGKIIISYSEK